MSQGEPSPDTCDVRGMAEHVCKGYGKADEDLEDCTNYMQEKLLEEYEQSKQNHNENDYPDIMTHCKEGEEPSHETCNWGNFVEELCSTKTPEGMTYDECVEVGMQ